MHDLETKGLPLAAHPPTDHVRRPCRPVFLSSVSWPVLSLPSGASTAPVVSRFHRAFDGGRPRRLAIAMSASSPSSPRPGTTYTGVMGSSSQRIMDVPRSVSPVPPVASAEDARFVDTRIRMRLTIAPCDAHPALRASSALPALPAPYHRRNTRHDRRHTQPEDKTRVAALLIQLGCTSVRLRLHRADRGNAARPAHARVPPRRTVARVLPSRAYRCSHRPGVPVCARASCLPPRRYPPVLTLYDAAAAHTGSLQIAHRRRSGVHVRVLPAARRVRYPTLPAARAPARTLYPTAPSASALGAAYDARPRHPSHVLPRHVGDADRVPLRSYSHGGPYEAKGSIDRRGRGLGHRCSIPDCGDVHLERPSVRASALPRGLA
ncbi:hypothetical protein DFH06DRAFT_1371855 [Mycena polygramma]|nr:hypothetical protein DFH06DRAFT_1371855 [Mycena polygramma]